MSTHDPISDLITRIRNAQMRAKPKVSTPGSKMRANVLEVLKTEGYIRGYASVEHASGRSELEIELKYFDGEPVIREIERVSKPGRPKRMWAAKFSSRCSEEGNSMSRIGKRPVTVPSGVTATVEGQTVKMKGPKGQLQFIVHDDVEVKFENGSVKVAPRFETNRARALYGTARAQVANLLAGVTKGFEKKLEITGVGYRAALQGKNLQLALGYSHDVVYAIPEGIAITVPKPTEIVITGNDVQRVGQVAAEIRSYRPPEPYKGKGVKYSDEFIFRKEGKKK